MKKILLIGGGGHCKSCIDVIQSTNEFEITGILDMPNKVGTTTLGVPIVGVDDELPEWLQKVDEVLITVGQILSSKKRAGLAALTKRMGAKMATIISPLAYVGREATVAPGSIIMHGVKLIAGSSVGANCIVNTNALIEHDAVVHSLCHISTAATINGNASVEDGCFIGSGAIVFQGVTVGADSVVGAGQVIRHSVPAGYHPGRKRSAR